MEKYDMNILNEQKNSINTKKFAIIELLTWILISLAICSCLWRNDCNVLIGLIIILTLKVILFILILLSNKLIIKLNIT